MGPRVTCFFSAGLGYWWLTYLSPGSHLPTLCLKRLFEKDWKASNSPVTGNIGGENIWGGLP